MYITQLEIYQITRAEKEEKRWKEERDRQKIYRNENKAYNTESTGERDIYIADLHSMSDTFLLT